MNKELIAPCGMNCGICGSYLAKKYEVPRRRGIISYCDGCIPRDKQCSFLKKKCEKLMAREITYCHECEDFPCANLKNIDKGYRTKYAFPYSMVDTSLKIQQLGMEQVLGILGKSHTCDRCGELLCVHNGLCYRCDTEILATMKNYRNE